jgi:mono/diheme cytochrome c family protein
MKSNRTTLALGVALLAVAGFVSAQSAGDVEKGKKLFYDTGDLEYPSCGHCHATVPVEEELKKNGKISIAFPVYNSAHRGSYKNSHKKEDGKGPATSADAGNICVVAFQNRKKLPAADIAALNAFIASVSPDKDVKPRDIKYAPPVLESFEGGDAEAGKKNVAIYCSTCHGPTDDHLQFELKPGKAPKKKIAMKVRGYIKDAKRKSGMRFKPNAGQMSFFATNRLSDKDLLDIIAYLGK